MELHYLQERIDSNQPFSVITTSGKRYEVAASDFIHLSPSKSTAIIFWIDEGGGDRLAIVPLNTISSLEVNQSAA